MNPMPSGGAHGGDGGAEAEELGATGAAQRGHLDRATAVDPAGPPAADETLGCTRTGAETAMQAAAAVAHGGLAALAAGAAAGAATGGGEEIA
jgi:hypothetical protein